MASKISFIILEFGRSLFITNCWNPQGVIMKSVALIAAILVLIFSANVFADKSDGALKPEFLDEMRNSVKFEGSSKIVYNALLKNRIKDLALDHDKLVKHEDLFNVTTKTKGITNQNSSGRCWLFASLNHLRANMMAKYKLDEFEFSQNYLAFYDKLEKANMFLELVIEYRDRDMYDRELQDWFYSPFGDGGWWFYVVELLDKYGCVPKDVMPETESSANTGMMNNLISTKLRQAGAHIRDKAAEGKTVEELRAYKEDVMKEVYKMLVMNLGMPPTEFEWRYVEKGEDDKDSTIMPRKTYTPQQFYKDVVDIDLRDYITLSDHPSQPKFKPYRSTTSRNMFDKEDHAYLNLPIDTLRAYAYRMILDGQPVVFGCDVGKDNDNDQGIFQPGIYDYESVYGVSFDMTKSERFTYGDITTNHMMLLTACDTANGKPIKWKVENSWGKDRGDGGYWTMYDDWFTDYVFEIIVPRKYVSRDILKINEMEPVVLPPWDPYSRYFK